MELWLWLALAALACAALALGGKVLFLRRAAREIARGFARAVEGDTNTLIDLSSRDGAMRTLAEDLNVQLRQLRTQRRRYQQGDRELKEAVAGLAHDLRTPLTAICGYLELLEGREQPPDTERCLAVIRERVERMRSLTEELFRYSLVRAAPEPPQPAEADVEVNRVLEESAAAFYAVFRARGITPEVHMPAGPVTVRADQASLERVLANLLNNALKYSDGDLDITLTPDGQLTFSNAASRLSGVQVEKLFDRYYTVEEGRDATGLGLAIARSLARRMGAELSARYEGGRLSVRLCLKEAAKPKD